jgi:glycosyltransferase involved in cell wall biosynthesis
MRVAYLPGSYRPDRCGVSHYTARLMAELAGRGVEPLVVTSLDAARLHARPQVIGATPGWGVEALAALPAAIRRLDADILHIQHAAASFAFRRAILCLLPVLRATGWRRPVVVTVHEYGWWEWRPRLLGWAWRRLGPWGESQGLWDREDLALLTGADVVIVTHAAAVRAVASRLPQLGPQLEQVPIGANIPVRAADGPTACAALRQRFGWEARAPVISYFGFLHPVKGLETLLDAFRRIVAARPEARLLLIGGAQSLALQGEEALRYQAKIEWLIAELGLEHAVHLTGYLPDEALSHCLAGSDIGVLPFHAGVTAKSGSLLVMWNHGLPVVATEPPELEPPLVGAAWFVPRRNPEALAAGLRRLLDDPVLRQRLALGGRQAVAGFSWGSIAERHLEIYRRLLHAAQVTAGWVPNARSVDGS